ncbi:RNA-binding S4 domain-containing protein [Miniphocaeibacter halophilus]|uniref:RNA-binding S4 domain-containing protein n=1 Tax=Miniphocaeibacter halophilus TaxID=2931922 RepID=A0AC61MQI2_9FIRM|nr:RNA-binding S4 domain-containing protein [Miniphocaeibacter halophilus]QQK07940.1 RNA-binding S4 domain-containing protein [Miniphocaeibacter halophilus]
MRIDKFLKNSRIIKRRTVAKEACDGGRVSINNKVAKSGDTVKVGDIIEIRFGTGELKVEVKEIIDNPKKNQASEMIEKVE